jgi:hypothetical protein
MTQEEILQYNKRCAEFLKGMTYIKRLPEGELLSHDLYKVDLSSFEKPYSQELVSKGNYFKSGDVTLSYVILLSELKFHSHWNWIMEIVEAIEKTYDEFHGYFGVFISSNGCTIQGTKLRTNHENPHYAYFNDVTHDTKREAVVQAINQFLIWYNENK